MTEIGARCSWSALTGQIGSLRQDRTFIATMQMVVSWSAAVGSGGRIWDFPAVQRRRAKRQLLSEADIGSLPRRHCIATEAGRFRTVRSWSPDRAKLPFDCGNVRVCFRQEYVVWRSGFERQLPPEPAVGPKRSGLAAVRPYNGHPVGLRIMPQAAIRSADK